MNSVFRTILRYNLKWDRIVYKLIDAAFNKNLFSIIPYDIIYSKLYPNMTCESPRGLKYNMMILVMIFLIVSPLKLGINQITSRILGIRIRILDILNIFASL